MAPRRAWTVLTQLLLAASLLSACASSAARTGRQPAPPPRLGRIAVIVLENKEYTRVIGSPGAPFLNSLVRQGAVATRYYAVAHPSLPNYLALIGGSTFGFVGHDCNDCQVAGDARNLVDEMQAAHISWKAYMEGVARPCSFATSTSAGYVRRHDPFMYFADVAGRRSRCRFVVPATQLSRDIARHALPRFVWLSPNLCHDMHDCSVYTGDRYLRTVVPPLVRALGPAGVLFITWDEGQTSSGCCQFASGGHIPLIAVGPAVRAGARPGFAYDHYSLLKTVEEAWGLPLLGRARCPCTLTLRALVR